MRQTFALAMVLGLAAHGATAQEIPETTLRLADSYPATHVISIHGAQTFINKVKELSGGRIKIDLFPAQQLGKAADNLRLIQTGVADIASVGPAYVSDKMPLSDVGALPGVFSDVCKGSDAFQKLASDGALSQAEYKPNKIRPLFTGLQPPYQIIAPRKQINGLADLKGLKIRASGGSTDILVRALGGTPVKLAGPDIREGLDRGTVDANLGPNSSLKPYDIYPLAKFGTQNFPLGSFVLTYSISERSWSGLPPRVQAILTEASKVAQQDLCSAMAAENITAIKEMEALGSKFHYATAEDLKEVQALSDRVIEEWTDGLERRGKPAAKVLQEFRAAYTN